MRPVRDLVWLALLLGVLPTARAGESVLGRLQEEIRRLAREASPAVVKVTAGSEQSLRPSLSGALGGGRIDIRALLDRSSTVGTGFLVSADGLVLTTYRIALAGAEPRVEFPDGTIRAAEVVGQDRFFKVALLKIEPVEGVKPLSLAPSRDCVPGSLGLLVGNGLGVSGNMTLGIVTSTGASSRAGDDYDNYMLLNTSIRPGDAGGPFLDPEGRVLGMAVGAYSGAAWVVSASRGGVRMDGAPEASGMGYLVPAADLRYALEEIRKNGSIRRGRLGVRVSVSNLEVGEVVPGTPAVDAGLKTGDVLVGLDDRDLESYADLLFKLHRSRVGATLSIRIRRDGEILTLTSRLAPLPASLAGLPLGEDEEGRVVVGNIGPEYAELGIRQGDVLAAINDMEVDSMRAWGIAFLKARASERVDVTLVRGEERIVVTLPTR